MITYNVAYSREDKGHVGICPAFPSLSYIGVDALEASNGIRDMVENVLRDMEQNNVSLPTPLHLREAKSEVSCEEPLIATRLLVQLSNRAFHREIAKVLHTFNIDTVLNTADFTLAEHVVESLTTLGLTLEKRDRRLGEAQASQQPPVVTEKKKPNASNAEQK
jgi:hypothetical protein